MSGPDHPSEPAEAPIDRAEELLERVRVARARLETLQGGDDAEEAVEVVRELADIAKEVEAELARARKQADADA